MTRALICDPELPAKTAQGRLDDIRACIGCNQACIGHFHAGYPISCIQFPESGREREFPRAGEPGFARHPPAAVARDVLVIGGGPAGLKAAAVAAERGHRVTLVEAERRVGGQVRLAQTLPGREEMGGAITNLRGRGAARGRPDRDGRAGGPRRTCATRRREVVIVATGAVPYRPPLELMGDARGPRRVGGAAGRRRSRAATSSSRTGARDWVGLGLATMLATGGHRVTLASSGTWPGSGSSSTSATR